MAKQALGKGLGALIKSKPAVAAPEGKVELRPGEQVQKLALDMVVPSPLQPRKRFAEGQLDELMQSIKELGIIQPLITRRVNGKLELIAGERRWRASQMLGLETVPVIEREATDQEVLEMALIENLQRQDLDAMEEAAGYVKLAKDFSMKQDAIAKRVGKSRASVANAMRLLDLQAPIQRHVADGLLTVGHAKAILGIKDPKEQIASAEHILRKNMTVRAAEKFVHDFNAPEKKSAKKKGKGSDELRDPHLISLQNQLRARFSTHVQITHGEKKGKIEMEYYGNDDLERVLVLLGLTNESE
ncbi:ParB/RepB/Spo0J family partition protein [Akkermansiaceae bacterium]|nr:ParB/RepB/Spo0J family partition protein [Akkermansiaceae bacterium]MDB4433650.1 ParB/RepB/Spo0J family partition protein [Akkermansiaceae bacterium]